MRCADRSRAASCYVVDLDWSRSGVEDAEIELLRQRGELLLRGRQKRTRLEFFGKQAVFRVLDAWGASGDERFFPFRDPPLSAGEIFVRLVDNGIRCITAPCPPFHMSVLNPTKRGLRSIDDIDLSEVAAGADARQAAQDAFLTREGLLAVGRLESF